MFIIEFLNVKIVGNVVLCGLGSEGVGVGFGFGYGYGFGFGVGVGFGFGDGFGFGFGCGIGVGFGFGLGICFKCLVEVMKKIKKSGRNKIYWNSLEYEGEIILYFIILVICFYMFDKEKKEFVMKFWNIKECKIKRNSISVFI